MVGAFRYRRSLRDRSARGVDRDVWGDAGRSSCCSASRHLFWVSGFDVLYAIADIDFDRASGLHSIPARFGIKRSLAIAKALHLITLLFLVFAVLAGGGSFLAAFGIVGVGILFAYEHSLVNENDLSKLNMAFFTMNGIIAVVFAIFVVLDELLIG